MLPVSAKYIAALHAGTVLRVLAYADLYIGATTPPQTNVYRCVLEDGTITADRTAAVRRTCSLTIQPDAAIVPSSMSSILAPNGAEIRPYFQITYGDGTSETIPTGTFQLTQAQVVDNGQDLQLTVQGMDRAYAIGSRKLLAPYSIAAGTNLADAIVALVQTRWPNLVANITPTAATAAHTDLQEGADPWAQVMTMAAAGGYETFFDPTGVLVGRPIPDPTTQPIVWSFADGDGLMKAITHTLNGTGISNDFIVHTTSTTVNPPVRGQASDTSPNSPTNISGPFGDRPTFIADDLVQTAGAAQAGAANALQASLGAADTLTLDTVPMPVFEVDDVVTVTRSRIGLNAMPYVVDRVTHSLRHDGITQFTLRTVS